MKTLPLKSIPSQQFSSIIDGQQVAVSIYQLADEKLYIDVLLNNSPVVMCVKCLNLVKVVRNLYFGLVGDFIFVDTQGSSDPTYDGLGSRFQLVYLTASEANNE